MINRLIILLFAPCVLLMTAACDSHKQEIHKGADASAQAMEIEKVTGGRTRIVWCENQSLGTLDVFADSDTLLLKGLDTSDRNGERVLGRKLGNYARPLLSSDGQTILYTDKHHAVRDDVSSFSPVVYRTDWAGSEPVRLAEGYAVQCWRDPVSGIEWVYALRDIYATRHHLPMGGRRLVRFRLDDPATAETVYEDLALSPDNIQFSRDGTQASSLFPWPNAGVLRMMNGGWEACKLATGCCPAMAPDNSGVSWVFGGSHREATFFADAGRKSWPVSFSGAPGVQENELYHPRWSNHARFITLTGPYRFILRTEKKAVHGVPTELSFIDSDLTLRPQVCLGRLSERAEKVEAWVQITSGPKDKYYPDAWIEGGSRAELAGFKITSPAIAPPAAFHAVWPTDPRGLVFLWHDHSALNTFQAAQGRSVESKLRGLGPARFGRLNEMIFDSGTFQMDGEGAAAALEGLSGKESSFEALVLPSTGGDASDTPGKIKYIFRCPKFVITQNREGALLLSHASDAWQTGAALPSRPFHLAVIDHFQNFDAYVDGIPAPLVPVASGPEFQSVSGLILGGGRNLGMLNVAVYNRALTRTEVTHDAQLQSKRVSTFAPPPARVRVSARLEELSPIPAAEAIAPYSNCLVACIYKLQGVLEGRLTGDRILVKHWALLGRTPVRGLPRVVGQNYDLLLERDAEHPELKGERVIDTTTSFDLESWLDVSAPILDSSGR